MLICSSVQYKNTDASSVPFNLTIVVDSKIILKFNWFGFSLITQIVAGGFAMARQKVLILGATGQTGGSILDGLLEDGDFVCNQSPKTALCSSKH